MSRFKAAGIHLALSALIVTVVLCVMRFVWYPKGFFKLLGGGELVLLIACVDLTLGPLLTLAIFKAGKKGLTFDLAVIAILQLSALIYGASVTFNSRPVFNVFEDDRFNVSLASDFKDKTKLTKAKNPKWQTLPWFGPELVAAKGPTDIKRSQEIMFSGLDWSAFPELYVPYDMEQHQLALKNAKSLSSLQVISEANQEVVSDFLAQKAQPVEAFVYLPIVYAYTAMAAVLDAKTGEFIEIIAAETP
jgi:hypothetical protein